MSELTIFRCKDCAAAWFPERLRCPGCGGGLSPTPAGAGRVEEQTKLHRTGERLGSIRLDAGPVVITRLDENTETGARVTLHTNGTITNGAIWARHRHP